MPLRFLEFDLSEDTDGLCTWDALASPAATHTAALLAETEALVQHLTRALGPAGPVDEGHRWDMDLQVQEEGGRVTLALSLSGGPELAGHLL